MTKGQSCDENALVNLWESYLSATAFVHDSIADGRLALWDCSKATLISTELNRPLPADDLTR